MVPADLTSVISLLNFLDLTYTTRIITLLIVLVTVIIGSCLIKIELLNKTNFIICIVLAIIVAYSIEYGFPWVSSSHTSRTNGDTETHTPTNSCSRVKMEIKHLELIKYGNSELRLIKTFSPNWKRFWGKVGFSQAELKAQAPKFDTSFDKDNKLDDIVENWLKGRYNEIGYVPTYEGLVKLLKDLQLKDLANDFLAICEKKLPTINKKMADRVDYRHLDVMEHQGKKVKILDVLKDHWIDLGNLVGYPVDTDSGTKKAFTYFSIKWIKQSLDKKEDRNTFPPTFEGFRQILLANEEVVHEKEFTNAVEEAGICVF